jgi:hypothetical protein
VRYYRLVAQDNLGRDSTPSSTASITVVGVDAGDIDAAILTSITTAQTTADNAQTTANGKNTVFYATTAPSLTGRITGDVWFDTDDGNKMYGLQGGAWVPEEWGTNAIENLAVTNGKIANLAVDNAKISTVDAAKVTTGFLAAARIDAGTISTSKLLVTSIENLCEDPGFEYNANGAWTYAGGASSGTTSPRSGARALTATGATPYVAASATAPFAVATGEVYRLSGWVRTVSGTSALNGVILRFAYGATAATATTSSADIALTPNGTGTTYVRITGTWTVPSTARFAKVQVVMRDTNATTYLVDDLEVFKMAQGELIVDGAITAAKIAANTITANEIAGGTITANEIAANTIEVNNVSPSFGSSLNLSANGSINFLVGVTDSQALAISENQSSIGTLDTQIEGAATVAGDAASAASEAKTKADTAQTTANTTALALESLGQTYRFTSTGAYIGAPDSPYEFVIQNTGAQILVNGVVVSWWDATTMHVPSFVGTTVVLANHQIEADPAGTGTVVRAI